MLGAFIYSINPYLVMVVGINALDCAAFKYNDHTGIVT